MNKPLCIYHANCADGFGAAWAVRYALGENVEFYAAKHGEPPPDVTGRDVYIVDFSYKAPVLAEMGKTAHWIVILDHHASALEDLGHLPYPGENITEWGMDGVVLRNEGGNIFAQFDMTRSGAMMAWNFFCPLKTPPGLIRVIQDRDLWQFRLLGTRAIQANLFSYPYDFAVWDKLMSADLTQLAIDGAAIERKQKKDVEELLRSVQRTMKIAGHVVPVANLPYTLASDAGNIMSLGVPFAACYYDTPTHREFSLRSAPDGMDVSVIAAGYGGGGHVHASGFRAPKGWEGEATTIMRDAIFAAHATFRDYEQQHLAKTPPDTIKARRNADMADLMDKVLRSE
jgi:oligoribonuclease NrnB/cAMP/cGMP phosphodiesterase (DHH superfamily)